MRFTDRGIAALKAKAERHEVWEDGRTGLGLRISPAGRKTWIYLYRFQGRPRRMTIGTYPGLGLASARVQHSVAREQLERGIDPGAAKVNQRQAERRAESIDELIDEYLAKHARPNKRSAAADERALNLDVRPAWGRRKANSITRRDVVRLLDGVVERGSPIMANRLLEIVRRMFTFAVERGVLELTPCTLVKPPAKEIPRDRVLNAEEIGVFWTELDAAKMSEAARIALRLLLATGQRRGEVVRATWAEFDLDGATWEIPASRTKSGRPHGVPLSEMALDFLASAKTLSVGSAWVFPSPRGDQPMAPAAVSHALHRNISHFQIATFTPHDLRRSCASGLAELGFDRITIAKILGHADGSITGRHYDHYDRWPERTLALDAWAAHIEAILTGKPAAGNVFALAARGGPA